MSLSTVVRISMNASGERARSSQCALKCKSKIAECTSYRASRGAMRAHLCGDPRCCVESAILSPRGPPSDDTYLYT
eukprot:6197527-Pleurochrysis_carterae.AAC.4